jgi:hypothetical protein
MAEYKCKTRPQKQGRQKDQEAYYCMQALLRKDSYWRITMVGFYPHFRPSAALLEV